MENLDWPDTVQEFALGIFKLMRFHMGTLLQVAKVSLDAIPSLTRVI